jgi:hypothetical protein
MSKTLTFSDTQCLDAALIMFRNTPETKNCSFLFVEGEDDEKFWNAQIIENCHIVFVTSFTKNNKKKTGKSQVIENIELLNNSRRKINGYLGIVDNDFDSLLGISRDKNSITTETHDLETLLLSSEIVFKKILAEFGDSERIFIFESKVQKTIQQYLLDLALPFAQIEYIKQKLQPSLSLKNLHERDLSPQEPILIKSKWQINKDNLFQLVENLGLNLNELPAINLMKETEKVNPWLLCNGHITIEILAFGFKYGALGKNNNATSERIASYLRGAIDKVDFYNTQLCQSIFTWQEQNAPYKILG